MLEVLVMLAVPLAIALPIILLASRPRLSERASARRIWRLAEWKYADLPLRFTKDLQADRDATWTLIVFRVSPERNRAWSVDPRWGNDWTEVLAGPTYPTNLWSGRLILPATEALPGATWVALRSDELQAARAALGIPAADDQRERG